LLVQFGVLSHFFACPDSTLAHSDSSFRLVSRSGGLSDGQRTVASAAWRTIQERHWLR
jgi:hypothetical protein